MSSIPAPALSLNAQTFAHVSDLHLPHEPHLTWKQRLSKRQLSAWSWRRRRAVQRPEILAALRADLVALAPARILVTGDITNFSLPEEFSAAAGWLSSLPAPVSVVPGNHDALVAVPAAQGIGTWRAFTEGAEAWPYVVHHGEVAIVGLNSAVPTAPLLAAGHLGPAQLQRTESWLEEAGRAGRTRIVMLHHPVADRAVSWRKALRDRRQLRAVLRRTGAELVLHGHARAARLEAVCGPRGPIPVLCVPSSTAMPNRHDEAARWHLLRVPASGAGRWAQVTVRQWSPAVAGFIDAARYELRLPDVG